MDFTFKMYPSKTALLGSGQGRVGGVYLTKAIYLSIKKNFGEVHDTNPVINWPYIPAYTAR